jgi:hypothetical protein
MEEREAFRHPRSPGLSEGFQTPTFSGGVQRLSDSHVLRDAGRLKAALRGRSCSGPFNFPRQVIMHTRRSSRFRRPLIASRLQEWMRWPIAPTDEFVGVWIPDRPGGPDTSFGPSVWRTETHRDGARVGRLRIRRHGFGQECPRIGRHRLRSVGCARSVWLNKNRSRPQVFTHMRVPRVGCIIGTVHWP